jgi:hypothetical protein
MHRAVQDKCYCYLISTVSACWGSHTANIMASGLAIFMALHFEIGYLQNYCDVILYIYIYKWHKSKWHLWVSFTMVSDIKQSSQWLNVFLQKNDQENKDYLLLNITIVSEWSFTSRFYKHILETQSLFAITCRKGKVPNQLGLFKRVTDPVPKMYLKQIQTTDTIHNLLCNTAPCKTLSLIRSNNFYLWWYTDPFHVQPSAIQFHVTCTLSGQVQCKKKLHKVVVIDGLHF